MSDIIDVINRRFVSGNGVSVERVSITADEWAELKGGQGAEPVAFGVFYKGVFQEHAWSFDAANAIAAEDYVGIEGITVEPVYTQLQPAPDVSALVEALKQILGWRELRSGQEFPIDRIEDVARNALAAQQGSVPKGENGFGLDARYFHEKLSLILRDISSYTPTEMARALGRMAITANPETMREPEFNIRDLIDEPKYRDTQPAVPEGWKDAAMGARRFADDKKMVALNPLTAAAHIRGLADLIPTTPQADGWLRCKDQPPTVQDQDCNGEVWFSKDCVFPILRAQWLVAEGREGYWIPTGLKRPQPPAGQEGA